MKVNSISFHLFLIINLCVVIGVLVLHKEIVNSVLIFATLVISAVFFSIKSIKNTKYSPSQIIIIVSICSGAIMVLCLQGLALDDVHDEYGRSALGWSSAAMVSNLIWFCWGAIIASSIQIHERSYIAAYVYTGVLFYAIMSNIEDVFKGVIFAAENTRGGSVTFNHLFVASNVVILFFYCFSALRGKSRLIISFIYFFLLFSLQGRAALLGSIITLLIYWSITLTTFEKLKTIVIFMLMFTLLLYNINSNDLITHLGSRFNFSSGVLGDDSFYHRFEGMVKGVEWLPQQALFGDPTIFINHMDGLGSYMHNFFSTWQIYGLPFSLILVISICYAIKKFSYYFDINNRGHVFMFLLLVYSLFQLIIAQSILFKLFWFILGVTLTRSDIKVTVIEKANKNNVS